MTEPAEYDRFADPDRLPTDDAIALGPGVAATWAWAGEHEEDGTPRLLVWHFCDHHLWPADAPPYWAATGLGKHTLVSRDPLHLEPSLLWPDCCGRHGFIRNGRWIEV